MYVISNIIFYKNILRHLTQLAAVNDKQYYTSQQKVETKANHKAWLPSKGCRTKNRTKNEAEAMAVEQSIDFDWVIPTKMPSKTNADMPDKGISTAHQKYAPDAVIPSHHLWVTRESSRLLLYIIRWNRRLRLHRTSSFSSLLPGTPPCFRLHNTCHSMPLPHRRSHP